jgi:hypothetical protein
MFWWQFLVLEMCNPTKNNHMCISPARLVAMKFFLKWRRIPVRQDSLLESHRKSVVWRVWCKVWHHLIETRMKSFGMPHPIRKETNSSLIRLRQTSEVTVPSMNTGPNIPTLDNAHHTVTLSGCSGLATVSFGFSEAANRTFCMLT